jgi:hypothetical protein
LHAVVFLSSTPQITPLTVTEWNEGRTLFEERPNESSLHDEPLVSDSPFNVLMVFTANVLLAVSHCASGMELSDTTMQRRMEHYAEEAMYERMTPGEGELPLLEMLAALPQDRVVGLEIPMRASAEAGVSAYDRLLPCVNSARSLLARASEIR